MFFFLFLFLVELVEWTWVCLSNRKCYTFIPFIIYFRYCCYCFYNIMQFLIKRSYIILCACIIIVVKLFIFFFLFANAIIITLFMFLFFTECYTRFFVGIYVCICRYTCYRVFFSLFMCFFIIKGKCENLNEYFKSGLSFTAWDHNKNILRDKNKINEESLNR